MMERFVGASVLVYHRAAVTQRQNRRDWNGIFADQPNLHVGAHAGNQILEPDAGLREQLVTPPGDREQAGKVIDKALGATSLIRNLGTLGSPDAPLDPPPVQHL